MTAPTGVVITARGSGLGVELTHTPSGALIATSPPKDNGGTGACFSPTDLVATGLVACALTTMALAAGREGLAWGPTSGRVEKRMKDSPRRIGELVVLLVGPAGFPAEHRARYEEIARGCPVARSLHPDLKVPMEIRWP